MAQSMKAKPKAKEPRTKTLHRTYSGGDERTVKTIRPHRKDWSSRPASERGGKKGKLIKHKTTHCFMFPSQVIDQILRWGCGVPTRRIGILSLVDQPRELTARDILQVLQKLNAVRSIAAECATIEVLVSETGQTMSILDMTIEAQPDAIGEGSHND